MRTQTVIHAYEFLWQLQTNSPCKWWPHPSRKEEETKTEKQKTDIKVSLQEKAKMKAAMRDTTWDYAATCASFHAFIIHIYMWGRNLNELQASKNVFTSIRSLASADLSCVAP